MSRKPRRTPTPVKSRNPSMIRKYYNWKYFIYWILVVWTVIGIPSLVLVDSNDGGNENASWLWSIILIFPIYLVIFLLIAVTVLGILYRLGSAIYWAIKEIIFAYQVGRGKHPKETVKHHYRNWEEYFGGPL